MAGYTSSSPPTMYVRALYDYTADDPTSLSFRQDDVIQVLTQLDSGWWDGIIRGVRGWFPSNYCAPLPASTRRQDHGGDSGSEDADLEIDIEDEFEDGDPDRLGGAGASGKAAAHTFQEEAAFWIPQATPDGRLFYFNTLTGDSTMELPLESPTVANENGPRDSTNAFAADPAKPPPELMAAGYEREEESENEQSASENEEPLRLRGVLDRKRSSYMSDGASPATSMESLTSPSYRSQADSAAFTDGTYLPIRTNPTSFIGTPTSVPKPPAATRRLTTNVEGIPLTWNRMVEDMRRSVERYRQAINQGDNGEYVRRVEDISDHLRLILAAGSGTTDNHSGNPSIISSNKALYPHFRDMMSRFSKLVLSSHIAAADWSAGDTRYKCLQEAEGVLNAVFGYVEVARQQRGEEIPRLFPGFVPGKQAGGSWRGNGTISSEPLDTTSFVNEEDDDPAPEPTAYLTSSLLENLVNQEPTLLSGIQALAERLVLKDKLVTPKKLKRISDEICDACGSLLDLYGPWIIELESINFSDLNHRPQTPQLRDFDIQKQKVYALIADMILACQAVGAPLADEWANDRGKPLEDRIVDVHASSKDLQKATLQLNKTLRELYESSSEAALASTENDAHSMDGKNVQLSSASISSGTTARSLLGNISQAVAFKESNNSTPGLYLNVESSKVKKFFGEVPVPGQMRDGQDVSPFLRLEHEGEVLYDTKTSPATIRGGTMTGLVEQLTRHDRYDSHYNNTFLLTYQSFTNAAELFEMLVRRWNIQPMPGLTKEEILHWVERKQAPIRFRIVNVLKSWLETYWMEENDNKSKELIQRIYDFATRTVAASTTPGARPLIGILDQRMRGEEISSRRLVPNSHVEAPTPILPKNIKKLKFLDIDPMEFARQLTIIESRLYGKIKPHECLNKIWQKKNLSQDYEPAANVKSLILHSNRLTNWVAETILGPTDVKKRVAIVKHFVAVADKCLSMFNFSTLTSIISAFATAPILRLNRTWGQVNAKTGAVLEKLRKLMGNTKNFAEYREALHLANPPCIPFFGVYLTDLTFIEDGIPSIIKKTDYINFSKRAKTAEVIREIQTYQNSSYPFKSIPEVQDYILSMMQSAGDVHEMYERSLQIEPREREDEKIARLLSESGFL